MKFPVLVGPGWTPAPSDGISAHSTKEGNVSTEDWKSGNTGMQASPQAQNDLGLLNQEFVTSDVQLSSQ